MQNKTNMQEVTVAISEHMTDMTFLTSMMQVVLDLNIILGKIEKSFPDYPESTELFIKNEQFVELEVYNKNIAKKAGVYEERELLMKKMSDLIRSKDTQLADCINEMQGTNY